MLVLHVGWLDIDYYLVWAHNPQKLQSLEIVVVKSVSCLIIVLYIHSVIRTFLLNFIGKDWITFVSLVYSFFNSLILKVVDFKSNVWLDTCFGLSLITWLIGYLFWVEFDYMDDASYLTEVVFESYVLIGNNIYYKDLNWFSKACSWRILVATKRKCF